MAIKSIACTAIPLLLASMASNGVTLEQLNTQVQQMNKRLAEQEQRLRVNGFASFGFTLSDEEMAYNGSNDEISFARFSKMGVQLTLNLDESNSVVTQLVSRGENQWETNAEWAYFKHQFNHNFSAKVGRIRTPAYMLSEYLDIGYAVPWAQMPAETYDSLTPFANIDGFDVAYTTDVGDNTATLQAAYGRSADDEYDLKDILVISATFQADIWSTRVAYATSSLTVIDSGIQTAISLYGEDTEDISGSFTSLGFTYDPGDLYVNTEYTQIKVDGVIVDADAYYATFGYRLGRLMPVLTFATAESSDDDEREASALTAASQTALAGGSGAAAQTAVAQGLFGLQAANNRNTQRIGLGLRYDFASGTALKVQYDLIEVDDASGLFDDTAWATNAAASAENPDKANILTISIDTVF